MQQILRPDDVAFCLGHVWDRDQAHFRPCFLPAVATVPAILATVILLGQIIRALVPRRPQWMRAFVVEVHEPSIEVDLVTKRRWGYFAPLLAILSVSGFILQLAASLQTPETAIGYLPVLVWFVLVQQVLLYRPRTIPYAVLAIVVFQLIAAATAIGNGTWRADAVHILGTCAVAVESLILVVLLFMPFRDPLMPTKDISKPFTEASSTLRSPEDNLSLWHFMTVSWVGPLLSTAKSRQLEDEDVWSLPYEFHHRRLHENFRLLKGTVIRRLVSANAIDLFILVIISCIVQLADYASPFFLQLILSTMADPDIPTRVSMTYAGLTLVARLISAQLGVFNLWFGRRCYERSRGEMITMLYQKTLDRKISFLPEEKETKTATNGTATNGVDGSTNGHANGDAGPKKSPGWWSRLLRGMKCFGRQKAPPPPKDPASMGKILNLMRNDVYEVAQRFWEFDAIVQKPLALIISVALVVNFLGWSSMIAVAVVIMAQVLNAFMARMLVYYEKKRRVATDAKLQVITQFVEAIRHLRWYGWQGAWLADIMSARQKELALRVICTIWNIMIGFVTILSLDLTPLVAFFAYTIIAGKHLTVDIAFPAMTLFQMMNQNLRDVPQLILTLINAWVAVGRIEDFMAEPDRQEMATEALVGDKLAIYKASFSWPGSEKLVLRDIDLSFPEGITVITGEVGTGKTALLQGLLGELDMAQGQLLRPQEPMGYCAQTPWLQSMSIRDNILFEEAYDDARYKKVLDACALTPDLAEFKAGDLSLIGENGIGLSGGQRARVALARAVYNGAKILLLDDPLSALDQQTAEAIVRNCFCGPLMAGRTVVLVTHRVDLVYDIAAQMVNIEDGIASVLDHEAARSDLLRRTVSKGDDEAAPGADLLTAAVPDKFIEDEHRAHGGVKVSVYWEYIKAGKLSYWIINIIIFVIARCASLLEAWLLKAWGEAYNTKSVWAFSPEYSHFIRVQGGIFDGLPSPDTNVKPWLFAFLGIALAQSITFFMGSALMLVIVYSAGKRMFRDIMYKVTYATFRFYDVTPVGRLMNRMTSDIGVVDGGIGRQFQLIGWQGVAFISSVTVIASVTPAFLIFTVLLTTTFVLIFLRFISASQSLRRLEMVSLTPLMSNFGSLLNGLTTVRAFRVQSRFQDRVIQVVDTFQKMDHFYWSAQAWLQYRYDLLSASSTFLMYALALATGLSPGLTAFVLLAAQRFVVATHSLCRQYGMLQMEFVSVERVVELLHLEQEPKGDVSPPAWWPLPSGDIKFNDVSIKYAPHLDPALRGVSFTIKGGSKTAIIGRTGSGKSTLALSMLGTVLPELGHIFVDNVDLATVDKQMLRTRVTFLAQDPVLFPGTMRQNLDPVDEHTDEECETVLQRVCERQGWTLDTKVEAGGKNLSQGQRQLVGLTRAVLRRSAIIILDEATASIDRETAMQIQQVMHEEMKDSTVITIAHRLEAVRNADYCIVLGKGRIIEQGPADEMLEKHRHDMAAEVEEEEEE